MSDISQIQVNGTTYDLCDATSRTQIANLQDSVDWISFNPDYKPDYVDFGASSIGGVSIGTKKENCKRQFQIEDSILIYYNTENSPQKQIWKAPLYKDYGTNTFDLNNATQTGIYSVHNPTNTPISNQWIGLLSIEINNNSSYLVQLAFTLNGHAYYRYCSNKVFSSWKEFNFIN